VIKWMAATLDGMVEPGGAVFEAKFMLPWPFSEEGAAEIKHAASSTSQMAQYLRNLLDDRGPHRRGAVAVRFD